MVNGFRFWGMIKALCPADTTPYDCKMSLYILIG